jgi:outer membrane protein OmpA-like peptidoglycan-associated protein
MTTKTVWLMAASVLLSSGALSADCTLGKQYRTRANEQVAKSDRTGAIALLRQSIAACPGYEAYQALGELLGHSKNRRDWIGAAEAFVEADARAPTPKARAQTLYEYASLVNDDKDPQNAYPMIKKAHALDPGRRDIAQLSADIEKQVAVPLKVQIERSFGLSVYRPLKETGGGWSTADQITGAGHRQINIPINFQFDSVELNQATQPNLTLLAHSLADSSLSQQQFVFIGHSDSRGDPQYNIELSRRRAKAMRDGVIQLEPTLADRIDVQGRGSSEPIDPGTDLRAMRANRRLQVILK